MEITPFQFLTAWKITTRRAIINLYLGKFKNVSCLLTEYHASKPVSKTIMTHPETFE
jgi:hypothetical protein